LKQIFLKYFSGSCTFLVEHINVVSIIWNLNRIENMMLRLDTQGSGNFLNYYSVCHCNNLNWKEHASPSKSTGSSGRSSKLTALSLGESTEMRLVYFNLCYLTMAKKFCRRCGSMDDMDATYRQEGVSVSQTRMRIEGEEIVMHVFEVICWLLICIFLLYGVLTFLMSSERFNNWKENRSGACSSVHRARHRKTWWAHK